MEDLKKDNFSQRSFKDIPLYAFGQSEPSTLLLGESGESNNVSHLHRLRSSLLADCVCFGCPCAVRKKTQTLAFDYPPGTLSTGYIIIIWFIHCWGWYHRERHCAPLHWWIRDNVNLFVFLPTVRQRDDKMCKFIRIGSWDQAWFAKVHAEHWQGLCTGSLHLLPSTTSLWPGPHFCKAFSAFANKVIQSWETSSNTQYLTI